MCDIQLFDLHEELLMTITVVELKFGEVVGMKLPVGRHGCST